MDIHFPFLLECKMYCTEVFWKNIFDKLTQGITPHYTIVIDRKHIYSNYKNKKFDIYFEGKSSYQIYNEIRDTLSSLFSISSKCEQLELLHNRDKEETDYSSWGSI